MKDTSNDSELETARRYAAMAPIDRLRMVSEMFESAKRLIAASVRSAEPDISETELRVRIFDRLYADDFDEATKVRLRASELTGGYTQFASLSPPTRWKCFV